VTISDEIDYRGICEILHFTTNRGIVGTLAKKALLSRYRLPQEAYLQHVLRLNAEHRQEGMAYFDKSQNWLDYVNLSISEINVRYLKVSKKWHSLEDIWWGILSFSAELITHEGVNFSTTNNSYPSCLRKAGKDGFNALFADEIIRKPGWIVFRGRRPPNLPTCEQAEVLYPKEVPASMLRKIYVEHPEHHDLARGWVREFGFRDIAVVLSTEKFSGRPN
jgi:ssDNA thymidine ADP-ribosyltransferase, DarT